MHRKYLIEGGGMQGIMFQGVVKFTYLLIVFNLLRLKSFHIPRLVGIIDTSTCNDFCHKKV